MARNVLRNACRVGTRRRELSPAEARAFTPCLRKERIARGPWIGSLLAATVAATIAGALPAGAQESDDIAAVEEQRRQPQDQIEEIVVFGRSLTLLGTADAASEGTVGGADLLVRPMLRVAELLEAVPGLIAAQHSGSGKANQYFLRGFNLDHGTDFSTYVDGVPLNLRSHGHGQGYLDINGLMPETVERINYRKGTYRADVGDFSMAGSSFITTIDRFDEPFMSYESRRVWLGSRCRRWLA